jgi:high-affinity iron transporter
MRAAGEAVVSGSKSLLALAVVVGVAVLREGFEVVLFLYGVVASEGGANLGIFLGGLAGLVLGAVVCVLTYLGLMRIPQRYLFTATSVMIAFLAAGMAAQAIAFLAQANALTALDKTVWDTSWLLSEKSILGRAMHTLIGYSEQPTEMQLVIYLAVLAAMFVLMKVFAPAQPPRPAVPAE